MIILNHFQIALTTQGMLEKKPSSKEIQILAAGNLPENSEVVKATWARI